MKTIIEEFLINLVTDQGDARTKSILLNGGILMAAVGSYFLSANEPWAALISFIVAAGMIELRERAKSLGVRCLPKKKVK